MKSGKSMPVVESELIGHTRPMSWSRDTETSAAGPAPVIERFRRFWRDRGRGWLILAALGSLLIVHHGYAKIDQAMIKEDATKQIQEAAAQAFHTDPANVEVRLADKRLVLPECSQPFDVQFPFSDRATAQLDCLSPKWRGFIQIRLKEGVTAFRYNLPLNKGETLKRSHANRHTVAPNDSIANRIVVLEDVLDLALREPVQAGDVILESHFMATPISGYQITETEDVRAWVATKIIPRGNRLDENTFSWEIVEGRVPTDLIDYGDRATAQLDCVNPKWRGFIQIRLKEGVTAFRYNLPLNKGETLKRSHATRHAVAPDDSIANRVVILEDVLDLALREPVQAGDIILESHFMATPISGYQTTKTEDVRAWVATKIIPRGNRLNASTFSWEIVEGRVPTDLIHYGADFAMLEALRDIMPGDKLRRSAVKMAPAVRKNEEVQVLIVRGALRVTNLVRISRDATIGESIDVVNVESGRPLKARVTGIGQVEIL